MEQRAAYVATGAFVVACVLALVGVVLWLGREDIGPTGTTYMTRFEGSVSGLREGNPVRYQGVKVGVVQDISLDPEFVGTVRVLLEISEDMVITEEVMAYLEYQGITGIAYVQLRGGGGDVVVVAPGARWPEIPSQHSQIETLFAETPIVLGKISTLLDRVNALLSASNRQKIDGILSNVEAATTTLPTLMTESQQALQEMQGALENIARFSEGLPRTLATTEATAQSIQAMATTLDQEAGLALREFRENARAMRKASEDISAVAQTSTRILADNRQPIGDFFENGLYEFSLLVNELRQFTRSASRIASEFEQAPSNFLLGDRYEGYQAK